MKKIGSLEFFNDIDFNLNFDFEDIMEYFKKSSQGIKREFLDEDGHAL